MARHLVSVPVLLGLGALGVGLLAIFLQPFQALLLQFSSSRGVDVPFLIDTSTINVLDTERDIQYVGRRAASGVEHFQNIFYAEDTSGPNRFAPPIPTRPAKGSVIDATNPGVWCPQGLGDVLPFTSQVTDISENCLSLRIARPGGTRADAKLPVMVWLQLFYSSQISKADDIDELKFSRWSCLGLSI